MSFLFQQCDCFLTNKTFNFTQTKFLTNRPFKEKICLEFQFETTFQGETLCLPFSTHFGDFLASTFVVTLNALHHGRGILRSLHCIKCRNFI